MGGGDQVKNFVLIGAAGYVAPRHMAAIKAVGGNLVAAFDPHDSVGVLDSYFPECRYFQEFERLDRFVQKKLSGGDLIDYVSICSPNYLHDSHSMWAMRIGADAICEKPIVLHARNLDQLKRVEEETGRRVWAVLQLRHHPEIKKLKAVGVGSEALVSIVYHTPRGAWYSHSWKGDQRKSGGVATNIGIHLFDLSVWLLGRSLGGFVNESSESAIIGAATFDSGMVYFDLSIQSGIERVRRFEINGAAIDLSEGFEDLHSEAYRVIVRGDGFGIEDARGAIEIVEHIRSKAETDRLIKEIAAHRNYMGI